MKFRILKVCRGPRHAHAFDLKSDKPYVFEQAEALRGRGHTVEVLAIRGPGAFAYLSAVRQIREQTRTGRFNVVHAHFGLAGASAVAGSRVPVVVTFHGSDINKKSLKPISAFAASRAAWSIYVSEQLRRKSWIKSRRSSVLPCGVDLELFKVIDKSVARTALSLPADLSIIVFGGRFVSSVKNGELAREVVAGLPDMHVVELSGFTREGVNLLLNAADVLMLTSRTEGSPQIVKEALSVNCPVVSTRVGDVQERLENLDGCFIVTNDAIEIRKAVRRAVAHGRVRGRERMEELNNVKIAEQLESIYQTVVAVP